MLRRAGYVAIALLLVGILVLLSRFSQEPTTTFQAGPLAVDLPFGNAPGAVGRARGIDGRSYGPLTFATNGSVTVVSDTYHQRLLWLRGGRVTSQAAPGQMIEDMAINPAGDVVAADNRALALWLFTGQSVKKIVQFDSPPGFSSALWRVGLGAANRVLVERISFGRGSFAAQLDEYTLRGRFVRVVASSRVDRAGTQFPSPSTVAMPIRNFQVAPDGEIYVEPTGTSRATRTIRVYRADGTFVGSVVIHAPEPIQHSDFLGINQKGWIYVAINLDVPGHAKVLIVNKHGQLLDVLTVPAVSVYAATYGRVLPSGVLYLDTTTNEAYQVREYRPVTRKVWRWQGF
ncbi:MAG: hypothetical protein OWU33_09040 [Firmicutes bacterium]|nr:hypothetical protein [Bacillota bacterium]